MRSIHALVVVTALAVPALATAAPVERRLHSNALEASSFLWNDWNKYQENYHPNYIADDDAKTAWVEGATSSGAGEWIRINVTPLEQTTTVRLKIRNGYQKSKALFAANARAKAVVVRLLPSKTELKATLSDQDGWQELVVTQPSGPVRAIELAVASVYEGTKYADLCISDVQVFATSETADNPAFEKSKRKELLAWRKARVAAAKVFAKKKIDLPLHTAYQVKTTELAKATCESCDIAGMIAAAAKDPGFKDWQPALAIAAEAAKDLDLLPRGQLALASKQALPEVDGTVAVGLEELSDGGLSDRGLHLPIIDSVSVMFADQLRILDVKDKLTASQFGAQTGKCKGDVTWVKRTAAKDQAGPDIVSAVLVGRCGLLEGREGSYRASVTELLVYGADGRLALVIANGMIDGYRWSVEDGKPMIVGGRALLYATVIDATKRQ